MDKFTTVVSSIVFIGAVGVVSYVAITRNGDAATTALGAIIALVSAGAGFFFRGRVQAPSNDSSGASAGSVGGVSSGSDVLLRAEGPATATVRTEPNVGSEAGRIVGAASEVSEK